METINSFSGGMNKDISKSLYKESYYIHAENFTLVTDTGLTTGSLRNANGNEKLVTIPGCSEVIEVTDTANALPLGLPVQVDISVSIGSYSNTFTNITSIQDLGLALQNDTALADLFVGVAYSDTRIIIYSLLQGNNLISNTLNVNIPLLNFSVIIPPVSDPKIIGWEVIRDQIILFTAENSDEAPVNQLGQIWKLTYDKYSNNPIITLLYNNYVNFSLAHPIPNPGGSAGNYETPAIQKVYWTDNYNRPRVLNTADPNTMALTPRELETNLDVLKAVSTIYELLDSGSIKTGIYQVSARLAKANATAGVFIVPSNPITVINEPEYQVVGRYEARDTGVTVSKSISARLYNLDTTYDFVEPVVLYRENGNVVPDIYVLPAQPIPDNGILSFTYTGNESIAPISLEEFVATSIVFDTVKTLVAKNNILFFGNVKYSDFDVDFDTRAYRFTGKNSVNIAGIKYCDTCLGAKTAAIKNSTGTLTQVIPNAAPDWNVPLNADAIQDQEMQAPNSTCNYLYQSDGETFGGEGPNVKYEFVEMYGINDVTENSKFRTLLDDGTKNFGTVRAPFAVTSRLSKKVNYNFDTPPQTGFSEGIQENNLYINPAGPFNAYLNKGYQRDETYRFGIVFFSKKGEPSYVHWIADIRMPKPFMPDPDLPNNPTQRNKLCFPISSVDTQAGVWQGTTNQYSGPSNNGAQNPSSGKVYGNNLGIKFTVSNLDKIADQISGYSIVRVKRKDSDKTVLGQGILNPAYYSGTGGLVDSNYVWFTPNRERWSDQTLFTAGGAGFLENEATLASPEFLFRSSPAFSAADKIDIIQVNNQYSSFTTIDGNRPAPRSTSYKLYNVWEKAFAPRAATFDVNNPLQDKATPAIIGATLDISAGFEGSLSTAFSFSQAKNWGWTGENGNDIDCAACCRVGSSAPGQPAQTPRGIGGSRLFINTGGTPFTNFFGGLNSIGLGSAVQNTFPSLLFEDGIRNQTYQGTGTNVYLANYLRSGVTQYGGNSYSARAYNEYIPTGHSQLVTANSTSHTDMVFGGDTYITLFDYAEQLRNSCVVSDSGTTQNKYDRTRNTIHIIPLECSFPIELRKTNEIPTGALDDGYVDPLIARTAPNKSDVYSDLPKSLGGPATGPNTTAEWTENFNYEFDYVAENDVMKFFPPPFIDTQQEIFDVRIHRSQIKANGELADSWGVFKPEDYLDLDTAQGPLTNLILFQNNMVAFQDRGVSLVSVNDRSLTQDSSGSEIILGTGGILARYDYISRIIGSRHQFSFTKSHDAVFWFDMNTKNSYKMTGNSPVAISVAKGMSSYFSNNLKGLIQISDNPYLNRGITSTYDFRYNEAIMTFKDKVVDTSSRYTVSLASSNGSIYTFNVLSFPPPDFIINSNTEVLVSLKNQSTQFLGYTSNYGGGTFDVYIKENPVINPNDLVDIFAYQEKDFTVGYNDIIDAYTSFYSFAPSVYINDYVSIFSPDETLNTIYRHDVGEHGKYYGTLYPSKLTLIVNTFPTETKVFDNYEMVTESIDTTGTHITDDLFNRIRLYNDYQNTDFQVLPTDGTKVIAKRKERTWNISNLRNRVLYTTAGVDPNIFDPVELSSPFEKEQLPIPPGGIVQLGERMRDKYLIVDLEYDNLNNYNFIFHTFKTHFRKSAR